MRNLRRSAAALISFLPLVLFLTGCPKTPTPSGMSAPAPAATGSPSSSSTAAARPSDFAANENLKDIHFGFDRYDIQPGNARILDANATWLKAGGDGPILIEGHCDERGTNEYNLALGERRAKATMNYLAGQGVPTSRVTLISYGKERPICTEHNEVCWARNRRVHFLFKAK